MNVMHQQYQRPTGNLVDQEGNPVSEDQGRQDFIRWVEGKLPEFSRQLEARCRKDGIRFQEQNSPRGPVYILGNEVYAIETDGNNVGWSLVGRAG